MNDSNLPGYGDEATWPTHAREYLSDEAKPFTESREYQDWLAEAADCIAHGHDVTWTVRRGFRMERDGVMFDDVHESVADTDDYAEACDEYVCAILTANKGTAEAAITDIRAMIRVEAMEHLAAKADSYAEYLKQQEKQDMAEARA